MTMMTSARFLRGLRQTPVLLNALLADLTAEHATGPTDGDGGWTVTEVVCHLHDFEMTVVARARQMLTENAPTLRPIDQEQLAIDNDHKSQDFRSAFTSYLEARRAFVASLENLTNDQWGRRGSLPSAGEFTVMELAMMVALHDVNHIEQIARIVGASDRLL
ncbi:MAG: hypothetical protein GYB67_11445 [Chloroflexi bacterium]|nr:hypothetical protein [Chloroflexota bacterium]